jgi:hypothetical protein
MLEELAACMAMPDYSESSSSSTSSDDTPDRDDIAFHRLELLEDRVRSLESERLALLSRLDLLERLVLPLATVLPPKAPARSHKYALRGLESADGSPLAPVNLQAILRAELDELEDRLRRVQPITLTHREHFLWQKYLVERKPLEINDALLCMKVVVRPLFVSLHPFPHLRDLHEIVVQLWVVISQAFVADTSSPRHGSGPLPPSTHLARALVEWSIPSPLVQQPGLSVQRPAHAIERFRHRGPQQVLGAVFLQLGHLVERGVRAHHVVLLLGAIAVACLAISEDVALEARR